MRLFLAVAVSSLLFLSSSSAAGHNITKILADHPDFSTFNHYLSATHLAAEINRRRTITVLAADNAAMASLLSQRRLPLSTLRNLLSLHVLVDYYGAKKLHQLTGGTTLISTVFQSTGAAPGTAGFVNITDRRAGVVTFSAADSDHSAAAVAAAFVKSVAEMPYNISVLQISSVLTSPAAEAPAPSASQIDLIALMSKKGCKTFADLLTAGAGEAAKSFEDSVGGGLTVFCPVDQAMKAFLPKFKNLTADGKMSLLLYHGIPVYESMQMLKTSNGVVNTLATDGTTKNFNFTVQNNGEQVTLKSGVTASITGTLIDEDPLAVYTIDEVLEPSELFKPVEAPAPAPAPAVAKAPKASKGGKKRRHVASPPAPAGPEGSPADEKAADENVGGRVCMSQWTRVVAVAVAVIAIVA